MRYGVVIYKNIDIENPKTEAEKRAIVFYDDDIEELEFLVKSHIKALNLDPERFSGGLVFEKCNPSEYIGIITSDGVYCPKEVLKDTN